MAYALSIDIGSTYTKGALFGYDGAVPGKGLELLDRAVAPTTVEHLPAGFAAIRAQLLRAVPCGVEQERIPVYFSSSAKGGLAIYALGIVPDLTLKTAKLTALSAGGKVVGSSSYKLTRRDLRVLEELRPDILLLAGGTNGGNETFLRHNAELLAQSQVLQECLTVVYAGNDVLAEEIPEQLRYSGYDVRVAENIMPEIDVINPQDARERVREVFLQRIVKGKGLDVLVREVGRVPNPTPYAVLSLVEAIARYAPEFGEFVLADLGGATTDIYSYCHQEHGVERVIYRGIPEPEVKRTVEGDLGMRVSARSVASFVEPTIAEEASFRDFIDRADRQTSYLPDNAQECAYDRLLAQKCLELALVRHAGRQKRVFTATGDAFVQQGKDLRSVRTLIGSGGFLSQDLQFNFVLPPDLGLEVGSNGEFSSLLPRELKYRRDASYIFPLLGNLVVDLPELAVHTALESIV